MSSARPPQHIILQGLTGSGKSSFIVTAPKPSLVYVFDAIGKDTPYLKAGPYTESRDEFGTRVVEVQAPDGRLRLEYYNDLDPLRSNAWERFRYRHQTRAFLDEGFVSLSFDSVSNCELLARYYEMWVINPQAKDPRKWFGASTDRMEEALIVWTIDLPINIVLSCHISQERNEAEGTVLRVPAVPGRLAAKGLLPACYSELYRTYVTAQADGSSAYIMQTRSDNNYFCTTQINAPNPCWNNWESLWENWR